MRPRKWEQPTPGPGSCASRWGRPLSSSRCCGDCGHFIYVRAELQTARELGEQLLQPGPERTRPRSPPGGPPCAGADLVLPGRVCLGPSALGAGHCPLRSPAAPLPGLSLWGLDPGVACLILCGLGPVVSWLSGPGPEEEPRGAHPGPGAVSPL